MNHNVESTRSTSRGRFSHWLQTVTYYTSHVRILRRTTYSKGIQRVIRRELRTSLVRIDAIKRNGSNYESMVGMLGIFLFFVGRVQHWESIRRRGIVTNSKVQIFLFGTWNEQNYHLYEHARTIPLFPFLIDRSVKKDFLVAVPPHFYSRSNFSSFPSCHFRGIPPSEIMAGNKMFTIS